MLTLVSSIYHYFKKKKNEKNKEKPEIVFIRDCPHVKSPYKNTKDYFFHENDDCLFSNVKKSCKLHKDKKLQFRTIVNEHKTKNKFGKSLITYECSKIETITYSEYFKRIEFVSSGLVKCFGFQNKGYKFGICGENSVEWLLATHGCHNLSYVIVTMFTELGIPSLQRIINECDLEVVFCSKKLVSTFESFLQVCPTLQTIVFFNDSTEVIQIKKNVIPFQKILDVGKQNLLTKFRPPQADDTSFIFYTSGTTGISKGVIHTHKLGMGAIGINSVMKISSSDTHLSYLPFAHMFEQALTHVSLFSGATICFGNPRTLVKKVGGAKNLGDLEVFKPTFFIGVPRVFETIKKGILTKVNVAGGLKKLLFFWVLNRKLKQVKEGKNKTIFLEKQIFGKIRKLFGGKLRFLVNGAAPLSKETNYFLRAVMGKNVVISQLYGLTETGTTVLNVDHQEKDPSSVGQLCWGSELKLVSVPEMGYFGKNHEGEICFKMETTCKGYYKNPKLTGEIIKDGYFFTGDIGKINPEDGSLRIIDRKKHLAKLSNGEYISLEQLSSIYTESAFIAPNGLCIFLDSISDTLLAIGLIDKNFCRHWCKTNSLEFEGVCKNQSFLEKVMESFIEIAQKNDLVGVKVLKIFYMFEHEWTPQNLCVGPTQKIVRTVVKKRYEKWIEEGFKKGREKKKEISVHQEKKKEKKRTLIEKIKSFFNF